MTAFLLQLSQHQPVAPLDHLPDDSGVVVKGIEVATAPQHECLVKGVLQPVVGLLGDAVFVSLPRISQGGFHPVMLQELGIGVVESPAALNLVSESRGVAGTDHLRRAAQVPQGILKSLLQGRECFPGDHLGILPA